MGSKTSIEWTAIHHPDGTVTSGSTWNPVTGCSKFSDGCRNCFAERLSMRFGWTTEPWDARYAVENVKLHPERLDWPLRWRQPRRVSVCSMSDLFHGQVPDKFIDEVFATMALASRHTFLVMTKRPERMRDYLTARHTSQHVVLQYWQAERAGQIWPPRNIWLGVSCEDQRWIDERIPLLLQTPAAVRFLSLEPLLWRIDLKDYLKERVIDWVIVGGESGGETERRLVEPCDHSAIDPDAIDSDRSPAICPDCSDTGLRPKLKALAWVRSLRDQCQAAGVAFFLKGWGGPTPKAGGVILDGREWREYPAVVEAGA